MENNSSILNLFFKTQDENNDEDIFDYNDFDGSGKSFEQKEKSIFYCKKRRKKNIFTFPDQKEIGDQYEIIFRARKSKFNYYELIYPIIKLNFRDTNDIAELDKRMWYLTNSENPNNKYKYKNEIYNLLEDDKL